MIGWLLLFAIGSVFVSNPFAAESSASATPDYARVMYLHGLLIGMVGLIIWVSVNPSLFGPGYVVATAGLVILGVALRGVLGQDVSARGNAD